MIHLFFAIYFLLCLCTQAFATENDSLLKKVNERLEMNDSNKAIDLLNAGIHKTPNDAELFSMRGPLLAQKKKYQLALNDYNKVIDLSTDKLLIANAYLNKALIESINKQKLKADKNFMKSIEVKPDFYISHLEYAKFLLKNGKTSKAICHFQKAKDFANGHTTTDHITSIDKLLQKAKSGK